MGGLSRYINILYLPIFLLFIISFFLLTSPSTSADTTVSANATVTVGSACSFNAVVDTPHIATIPSGTNQSDIGQTTFTVVCNDTGGYSIYAVGYSGFEVGNTKLLATINGVLNSTYDINTGSNASGTPSSWAMKLAPSTNLTSSNILNGYGSYSVVPSSYVKVATLVPSSTPVSSSSLTATYRVNSANTQPAGFYNAKVRYVLVNPATNVPNEPHTCASNKICYWPNGGDMTSGGVGVVDSMGDQSITSSATSATLWASNFQRPGYGFAGWSDAYDYVANVGSASNPNAHIYGPNETIEFTAGQYSTTNGGLSLYAVWVSPVGYLQDWTGCSTLTQGNVTALTDARDNDTYAVAKLADSKCWIIENLRLDYDADFTESLSQGFGGVFSGLAQPETDFSASTTANTLYKSDSSGDIAGVNGATLTDIGTTDYPSYRMPRYDNRNISSPSLTGGNNVNIYSYGNYYSWPAAKANTDNAANSNAASTSLCPSGWRLPTGINSGDFGNLSNSLGGYKDANNVAQTMTSSTTPTGTEISKAFRSFPNNFVYSGYIKSNSVTNRAQNGHYWSATGGPDYYRSVTFVFSSSFVMPGTSSDTPYTGIPIRCVIGN